MLFSNTRIKIVFLGIIFFYLFLFPVIFQPSWEFDNTTQKKRVDQGYIEKNLKSSGYWNLDFKIHIDNNWSETKTTYDWCSGSGTWSDPYVIENVTVNGENSGSPILIENSNGYFRIKHSTFYNSGSGIFPIYEGGIKLVNVTKGIIINNIAFDNQIGILLYNSENNTILENIAYSNTHLGISLEKSNNNYLSENNVTHNKRGIYLYISHNNTLSGNIANNNTYSGIILGESNNNLVWGNNISYNIDGSGISLSGSNENIVSLNNIENNSYGISLYLCNKNNISENTATNNKGGGIRLSGSENNILSGNTAINSKWWGMYLSSSYNNTLSGNKANNNSYYGIYLYRSDGNTFSRNIANYNNESGIFLHFSDNNSVSGNFANNNYYGINLTVSNFNNITENTLFDNKICYSEDETSIGNTFKYNICVKAEPSEDNWIISVVIGIIVTSIILIGLSVFYWQFKRKVK